MKGSPTHIIDVKIGVDLSAFSHDINIPGAMLVLGANNEAEITNNYVNYLVQLMTLSLSNHSEAKFLGANLSEVPVQTTEPLQDMITEPLNETEPVLEDIDTYDLPVESEETEQELDTESEQTTVQEIAQEVLERIDDLRFQVGNTLQDVVVYSNTLKEELIGSYFSDDAIIVNDLKDSYAIIRYTDKENHIREEFV